MSGLERAMLVGLVKRDGLKNVIKSLRRECDHQGRMEGVGNFHGKKDRVIQNWQTRSSILQVAVDALAAMDAAPSPSQPVSPGKEFS